MERTISGMVGKGSVSHNSRSFTSSNVDKERTKENVTYCNKNIKEIYHELFDPAVGRHNAKQKRNDRKINDYYEKIRTGKQEKLFHEVIFQIGNKDDMNARSENGQLAKQILDEFAGDFQARNPNLRVFSAHLHMDEETPHLHIDFVPFIRNSSRGMDTRVTLKGALNAQGFKGGSKGSTEWGQWMDAEKKELSRVMARYGVKWKQKGTRNRHLSVLDYQKQEREKEVAGLDLVVKKSREELTDAVVRSIKEAEGIRRLKAETDSLKQDKENLGVDTYLLKFEKEELTKENEKLVLENRVLAVRQEELKLELEQLTGNKAAIQRNIRVYDEGEEWKLPESAGLMNARAYREQKALPLVRRLKALVKKLTAQCLELMDRVRTLMTRVSDQEEQISNQTDKLMEQGRMIGDLHDTVEDYARLRYFIGVEKADNIIAYVKTKEDLEERDNYYDDDYMAR